MRIFFLLAAGGAAMFLLFTAARAQAPPPITKVRHAPWAENAVIYELNVRQFTQQGTFRAIMPRVDELKRLGVNMVWFMPIHPIGAKNRKGTLGSYYAVKDFRAVNPEFGTLDDFKALVAKMHAAGMRVIIDFVPNHTSWDNPLAVEHPDWYAKNAQGNFIPPVPDWADVIQLDYSKQGLRDYMYGVMEYWVRDVGIDGYRADVAGRVPTDFWNEARARLERIKPVFMLAEAEKPELLLKAFDADYASEYFHLFRRIAKGEAKASDLDGLRATDAEKYPRGSWRMLFTTNHDQNTWLDTDVSLFGVEGSKTFALLTYALPGKPLIYNGQELGNPKKLAFFERDPIAWKESPPRAWYERLTHLYTKHASLHAGRMHRVSTKDPIYALIRQAPGDAPFLVVANLSGKSVDTTLTLSAPIKTLEEQLGGGHVTPGGHQLTLRLEPWGRRLYRMVGP